MEPENGTLEEEIQVKLGEGTPEHRLKPKRKGLSLHGSILVLEPILAKYHYLRSFLSQKILRRGSTTEGSKSVNCCGG